jgi:hypothetical protein
MNLLSKYSPKTFLMVVRKTKSLLGKKSNNLSHLTGLNLFQKLVCYKVLILIKLNGCHTQLMTKIKIISNEKMNLFGSTSSNGFLKI